VAESTFNLSHVSLFLPVCVVEVYLC